MGSLHSAPVPSHAATLTRVYLGPHDLEFVRPDSPEAWLKSMEAMELVHELPLTEADEACYLRVHRGASVGGCHHYTLVDTRPAAASTTWTTRSFLGLLARACERGPVPLLDLEGPAKGNSRPVLFRDSERLMASVEWSEPVTSNRVLDKPIQGRSLVLQYPLDRPVHCIPVVEVRERWAPPHVVLGVAPRTAKDGVPAVVGEYSTRTRFAPHCASGHTPSERPSVHLAPGTAPVDVLVTPTGRPPPFSVSGCSSIPPSCDPHWASTRRTLWCCSTASGGLLHGGPRRPCVGA